MVCGGGRSVHTSWPPPKQGVRVGCVCSLLSSHQRQAQATLWICSHVLHSVYAQQDLLSVVVFPYYFRSIKTKDLGKYSQNGMEDHCTLETAGLEDTVLSEGFFPELVMGRLGNLQLPAPQVLPHKTATLRRAKSYEVSWAVA